MIKGLLSVALLTAVAYVPAIEPTESENAGSWSASVSDPVAETVTLTLSNADSDHYLRAPNYTYAKAEGGDGRNYCFERAYSTSGELLLAPGESTDYILYKEDSHPENWLDGTYVPVEESFWVYDVSSGVAPASYTIASTAVNYYETAESASTAWETVISVTLAESEKSYSGFLIDFDVGGTARHTMANYYYSAISGGATDTISFSYTRMGKWLDDADKPVVTGIRAFERPEGNAPDYDNGWISVIAGILGVVGVVAYRVGFGVLVVLISIAAVGIALAITFGVLHAKDKKRNE